MNTSLRTKAGRQRRLHYAQHTGDTERLTNTAGLLAEQRQFCFCLKYSQLLKSLISGLIKCWCRCWIRRTLATSKPCYVQWMLSATELPQWIVLFAFTLTVNASPPRPCLWPYSHNQQSPQNLCGSSTATVSLVNSMHEYCPHCHVCVRMVFLLKVGWGTSKTHLTVSKSPSCGLSQWYQTK